MKQLLLASLAVTLIFTACKRERYYDLTAGKYINLEKDAKTGRMVNTDTHEPVYIYVDTETKDTIYGAYKIKYGDYKKKVDGDEVKIKDGDTKIKIEDGEKKVKKDD